MLQATALVRVFYFFRITRGHRGYEIRIDDAPFHEVDGSMVVIILEAIRCSVGSGIQTHLAEHEIPGHALMLHIVQGVANPGVSHSHIFVHVIEEYRNQPGLPVMTVDDVGMLAGLEHEFQRRPAKEGEALGVVLMTVIHTPIEEILVRMWFDKKTF